MKYILLSGMLMMSAYGQCEVEADEAHNVVYDNETRITHEDNHTLMTFLKSCAVCLGAAGVYKGDNYMEKMCSALLCSAAGISLASTILHEQEKKGIRKPWQAYFEKVRVAASGTLIVGTLATMMYTIFDHVTDFYSELPALRNNISHHQYGAVAACLGLYYLLYKGIFVGIPAVAESVQDDIMGEASAAPSVGV